MDPSQVSQIVISGYICIRKLDCQERERVDGCGREEVAGENDLSLGNSFLETEKGMVLFSSSRSSVYSVGTKGKMPWW